MAVRTTNRQLEFWTWPESPTTTVTNTGLAGTDYNAVEVANHYTTVGAQTAQQITANNEAIIIPNGAAIDTPAAFTIELQFRYDQTALNNADLFAKGPTFHATYQHSSGYFYLYRSNATWYIKPNLVNGHWYNIQISWGASNSTPIIKVNNVAPTLRGSVGSGSWTSDAGYDLKVMNDVNQGYALRSTVEVVRFYDAALSDAELQANYAADILGYVQTVTWTQDGSTYKVPNVGVDDLTLESVVGISNAWHEGYPEPDVGAVAMAPTAEVLPNEFPLGGHATARAYAPMVVAARFPDVPPGAAIDLTHSVRAKFVFNPIVGED